MLGSAQKHIDSVSGLQEPHFLLLVTSHEGDDDDFGLFTLKVVWKPQIVSANHLIESALLAYCSDSQKFAHCYLLETSAGGFFSDRC